LLHRQTARSPIGDQETMMPALDHSVSEWLALIQAEYREIPGLSLTKPQVQRLWGLDEATCDALVDALEAAKFLRRTPANTYVLTDAGC
jgi:hypothetical protein